MSNIRKVAVFVGSLRKGSYNRKMAQALAEVAPPQLKLEIVEIGELPLYNQDSDTGIAPARVGIVPRKGETGRSRRIRRRPNTTARSRLRSRTRSMSRRAHTVKASGTGSRAQSSAFPRRDRRLRGQPSSAPVVRVPQRAHHAAAGSLHRRRRGSFRCRRQTQK